jgi:hypothetical protein
MSRYSIYIRAKFDNYRCCCPDCSEILSLHDICEVIYAPKINKKEDLKSIWLRDINKLGRRYIAGWFIRGVNRLEISLNELECFLYLIKLCGPCNFAKRNIMYDSLKLMSPESTGGPIMDRRRFNLIIITWHYLNQLYFRRLDKTAYHQLGPQYKVGRKIIRRFEGYYKLNSNTNNMEL